MTSFKIITAVWGCPVEWLALTLDSICTQAYDNWEVCVVVDEAIKTPQLGAHATFRPDLRGIVLEQIERRGIVQNQWEGIHMICSDPEDVVVWVDGDGDQLLRGALHYLDRIYELSDTLMTYGSYECWPPSPTSQPARPWPVEVIGSNSYREYARFGGGICHNHLRTMKYKLIQQMDESDMKRADGTWLMGAADSAFMFPALELSRGRSTFIEKTLLKYHADHEHSDWRNGENWCDIDNHEILTRAPKR